MKMFKRIFATFAVVVVTICALLGASYLVGWLVIEPSEFKEGLSVSLTYARTIIGFVSISMIYTSFRVMDFFEYIFKLTGDE